VGSVLREGEGREGWSVWWKGFMKQVGLKLEIE